MSMSVDFAGVKLKNPVVAASGTFGFGEEYNAFYDAGILGGICTKGLTWEPREGNTGRRVCETPSGMMNSVGLQNPGVRAFMADILPGLRRFGTAIICNLGGSTVEDYLRGVDALNSSDIDIIELNISCPNVKAGGMQFGLKADRTREFVKEIRTVCKKKLMVKLSPNAEDITALALACENAGADALSLINTVKAMAIDIKAKRPVFDNIFAGLSGPAVKPIALRMVYEVCHAVEIPVMGLGGIESAADAVEFIMAGAHAVQIGTANFLNPMLGKEMAEGLERYMLDEGIEDWGEIRKCV